MSMDNVPSNDSLICMFPGSVASTSVRDPTDDKNDSAPSPSTSQLRFQGVGSYDPSVGVPLATVENLWRDADAMTKEFRFWGNDVNQSKDGFGTFTTDNGEGDSKAAWWVEDGRRHMHWKKEGPDGTTFAGLYDRETNGIMTTVCYIMPPTREGEVQEVGHRWEGPYIPEGELPYSRYEPHNISLIVPSASPTKSDAYPDRPPSSKLQVDWLPNLQNLLIEKPLSSRPSESMNIIPSARRICLGSSSSGSRCQRSAGVSAVSIASEPPFPKD